MQKLVIGEHSIDSLMKPLTVFIGIINRGFEVRKLREFVISRLLRSSNCSAGARMTSYSLLSIWFEISSVNPNEIMRDLSAEGIKALLS